MRKRFFIFSLLLLSCSVSFPSEPSASKYINKKALGGFVMIGSPYYPLPEGTHYTPVLFIANYHQPFFRAKKFFNIAADLSPQLGFACGKHNGLEAGLNVSIQMCFAIGASTVFSFQAGSGPHYISYKTSKQASGFIFSDNFQAEFRRKLPGRKLEMSFIFGYRHISNANTNEPNNGIDNIMFGFGWSRLW